MLSYEHFEETRGWHQKYDLSHIADEKELLPAMPAGRFGTPDDAARLVAWLASDEAAWITGQVLNSEGGFLR